MKISNRQVRWGASALVIAFAACTGSKSNPPGGTFSHDAHFVVNGSHAQLACSACHDPAIASFSLAGGGVDCLHCHADADVSPLHAAVTGYAWTTGTCINCHKTGAFSVDHTLLFPIGAGKTHAGIGCVECHGATKAKADLLCTSCHSHDQPSTDGAHAAVTGYSWSSPACYDCHPDGNSALPANHDTALFQVTGSPSHGSATCSQCHGATKSVADLTCTSCHTQAATATQHAAIPASTRGRQDGVTRINYQWSSDYCLKCHADDQVQTIATHPRVSNGITGGDHHPFCLTCHTTMSSSGKTWAVNFDQNTCLACHNSNNP